MKQTSSSTISIYSAKVMDGEKEQPKNTQGLYRFLIMERLCLLESRQLLYIFGCFKNMKRCPVTVFFE